MEERNSYSMDLKLKVVAEYDKGFGGYKLLAKKYNLSRDLVRSWCCNAKLHPDKKIPFKEPDFGEAEKNLAYYRNAAAYWEEYAHQLEEQLEKLDSGL